MVLAHAAIGSMDHIRGTLSRERIGCDAMIRIAITAEVFDVVLATLPRSRWILNREHACGTCLD